MRHRKFYILITMSPLTSSGTATRYSSGLATASEAYGRGDIVYFQAGDLIAIGSTYGSFTTLFGSNNLVGGTTANGQPTGIVLFDNAQVNVVGSNNSITLGSGDSLGAYGGGNTISTQAGDTIAIGSTSGWFDAVVGSGDVAGQVAANGQPTGIVLFDNAQVNVVGSGNSITLGSGDSLGAYGGGNTISTQAGDTIAIGSTSGWFDAVVGSGDAAGQAAANGQPTGIVLFDNAQANVVGSHDNVTLGTGDSLGLYGGGNAVSTGAGDLVAVGSTNGDFDTIRGDGDVAGQTASNGQPTGIVLYDNAQANVFGNHDNVALGTGDSLGAYGGGNAISTGAGNLVAIGGTNGVFDTVQGNDDIAGGVAANGQPTGIVLFDNAQANVDGTHDSVTLGTGDSLGAYGGNNTISTQSGNLVVVGSTLGAFDTINGNGDRAGSLTANGQVTGIVLASGAQANVVGSNNTASLGTGDSLGIYGGGNTINTGAGDLVYATDTGGNYDTVYSFNDLANATAANGQTAGIILGEGAGATVIGGGNSITVGLTSVAGVYGNGNQILGNINDLLTVVGTGNSVTTGAGSTLNVEGSGNSATITGTAVNALDGNPIALTGTPTNAGQLWTEYANSPATIENIDEVYQEVLGRSVDTQGLSNAQALLASGGTLDGVRAELATSSEASSDLASTLATVGADPASAAELSGFQAVLSAPYGSTIEIVSHEGQVLANTDATNLLAELSVLETLDNGRTLALGLPGGNELTFKDTAQLTDFLYAVAVQKSQANQFVTDTFNQDIAWLNRVDQPMLDVANNLSDLASANASSGNANGATLANAASRIALDIAAQDPGARTQLSEKVSLPGHTTEITVYPGTNDHYGDVRFHDIDPGILGILEAVGTVILNVAAAAFPETGLPYAAAAVDAAEAGEDFAKGNVLGGLLSLVSGAGQFEIGLGKVNDIAGATTTGHVLLTASQAVGGVYGAVIGAENGDALGAVAGTLEAIAAVASGIGQYSTDADIVSLANEVRSGLNTVSSVLTTADAFASGNLAGGLIQSLGLILSNVAADFSGTEGLPATSSQLPFGTDPNTDGQVMVAGDTPSIATGFLRALGLIGTDAHNTLAAENSSNPNITYNKGFGGLFGGARPDFVYQPPDGGPLQVIELKPIGQEPLAASQLARDLTAANASDPSHPVAVAGDPKVLFNGYSTLIASSRGLLQGSTYSYQDGNLPGVATYSTIDRQSSVSAAFNYLGKTSGQSTITFAPLPGPGVVLP